LQLLYTPKATFHTPPLFRSKFQIREDGVGREKTAVKLFSIPTYTIPQRNRQTDGRTTCRRNTTLCVETHGTRSQAVARITDHTASQHPWGSRDVIGHVTIR